MNDFNGDLLFGQNGENHLKNILDSVEVKTDRGTATTGNVAVEFRYRGKLSGISTSNAKYWAFILDDKYKKEVIVLVETERLKRIARNQLNRIVRGGDNNESELVLIPKERLLCV